MGGIGIDIIGITTSHLDRDTVLRGGGGGGRERKAQVN